MFKIGILFEDREFEHDIYELIRAFYPGSEIHSFYEKEEEAKHGAELNRHQGCTRA